jgi:hypothetical protein
VQEVRTFGLGVAHDAREDPLDVLTVAIEKCGGCTGISSQKGLNQPFVVVSRGHDGHKIAHPLDKGQR